MKTELKLVSTGLSLFLFCGSAAYADDCQRIASLAFDLQWDRQHLVKQDFEAETLLEKALKTQVFQQP